MNLRELLGPLGGTLPWMPSSNRSERLDPVRLPRDERPHRSVMEWWHFMGYVESRPTTAETNLDADPKQQQKLRIPRQDKRLTFVMSILRGQVQQLSQLGSIVILIDHERKTHTATVKLGAMQSSYFELQDGRAFRFHFGPKGPALPGTPESWSATGGMGTYSLAINTARQMSLELRQSTPAVFLDKDGLFDYGNGDGARRTMAYYLWPMLEVEGVIGVGADEKAVVGQAWMEHQWGDVPIGDYCWRYLAVIIEHGEFAGRWSFFATETRNSSRSPNFSGRDDESGHAWQAFWIKPDGRIVAIDSSRVEVKSKNYDVYPLIHTLRVQPQAQNDAKAHRGLGPTRLPTPKSLDSASGVEFTLSIEPVNLHQECRSNLPGGLIPAFWEGACDVFVVKDDETQKEKIGWAIMELAGYR